MVGRLLSFWDGIFSRAMLNFRWVIVRIFQRIEQLLCDAKKIILFVAFSPDRTRSSSDSSDFPFFSGSSVSSESFFSTGLFADPADPLHFCVVHRAWYVVDLRALLCQQLATLPWQPGSSLAAFFRARFWLMDLLQKDSKGENSWLTFSSTIMAQREKITIGDSTTIFQLHHDGRKGTTLDGSEILHQVVDTWNPKQP